ncbi:unnamed protein product [Amaranthus hypochondriacus]
MAQKTSSISIILMLLIFACGINGMSWDNNRVVPQERQYYDCRPQKGCDIGNICFTGETRCGPLKTDYICGALDQCCCVVH